MWVSPLPSPASSLLNCGMFSEAWQAPNAPTCSGLALKWPIGHAEVVSMVTALKFGWKQTNKMEESHAWCSLSNEAWCHVATASCCNNYKIWAELVPFFHHLKDFWVGERIKEDFWCHDIKRCLFNTHQRHLFNLFTHLSIWFRLQPLNYLCHRYFIASAFRKVQMSFNVGKRFVFCQWQHCHPVFYAGLKCSLMWLCHCIHL